MVCVAEHSWIVELFQRDAETFSGRMSFAVENEHEKEWTSKLGIFTSDGELWREHRRFAMQTLRELGLGKARVEDMVRRWPFPSPPAI